MNQNRIIKFRVWDNKAKLFTFDYLIHQTGKVFVMYVGHTLVDPNHEDYVIQQFTSLLDKNNKEIYEGDIIKYKIWQNEYEIQEFQKIRYVEFKNGCFYPREHKEECEDGWYSYGTKELEVIGNIFENPELCK